MDMQFTSPRATFEETLAFANAVREAGGGAPLDALMPAVPNDPTQCLVAKNLNFNCCVNATSGGGDSSWYMEFTDEALRDRIAKAMGLPVFQVPVTRWSNRLNEYEDVFLYRMQLPAQIGRVARDFDTVRHILRRRHRKGPLSTTEREEALIKDMLPYIDASVAEVRQYGLVVDGKLVL